MTEYGTIFIKANVKKDKTGYDRNYWIIKDGEKAKQLTFDGNAGFFTVKDNNLYFLAKRSEEEKKTLKILDQYKSLYNSNKTLIGWLNIADTIIDYPVMQTDDNEYYLNHNIQLEEDRNGALFLDSNCDITNPGTNFIIYGHNMKSGKMFGSLDKYADQSFYEKHKEIRFDTLYEEGTYEVMYVFRSRVYQQDEIVFKYYQFYDANSEEEFQSYMKEMEALSLYDTGVKAEYGDHLLTLSTCDYEEKDGRFVVVAKRVK